MANKDGVIKGPSPRTETADVPLTQTDLEKLLNINGGEFRMHVASQLAPQYGIREKGGIYRYILRPKLGQGIYLQWEEGKKNEPVR